MVLPVCCQEEESRKVISAAVARLLGTSQIDPHAASLSGQRQLSAALRARDAVAGALDAAAGGFGWMPFPSVWTTHWPPCAI